MVGWHIGPMTHWSDDIPPKILRPTIYFVLRFSFIPWQDKIPLNQITNGAKMAHHIWLNEGKLQYIIFHIKIGQVSFIIMNGFLLEYTF